MTQTGEQNIEAIKACVLKALDDNKAADVVDIDLRGKSTIADFMVLATGGSARQVSALAKKILEETNKEFPGIPQRETGQADRVLTLPLGLAALGGRQEDAAAVVVVEAEEEGVDRQRGM